MADGGMFMRLNLEKNSDLKNREKKPDEN